MYKVYSLIKKPVKLADRLIYNIFLSLYIIYVKVKKKADAKVLIICNDHIGDTVIRIEYINKLITNYGKENTYFVASGASKDILQLFSNNIYLFNPIKFNRNILYRIKFVKTINKNRYDKVISLIPNGRHDVHSIYNSILTKYELYENKDKGGCEYVLDGLTDLTNALLNTSFNNEAFRPDLNKYLCESEKWLSLQGIKYIAIGLGADSKQRMYPTDKFSIVLNYLKEKDIYIVLLGNGNKDEQYYKELIQLSENNEKILNLVGKTTLRDTINIVRNSQLFLGVESGLWNIAYCLNIPSIVIYGGGHWGRFKHHGDNIKYVNIEMNCFQCNWECIYDSTRLKATKCIKNIEVNQIRDALKALGV